MIIATRMLKVRGGSAEAQVPITLFVPTQSNGAWSCAYEIGWPSGKVESAAWGFDSVQAIILALQKIGSDLYTSSYHKSGKLSWEAVDKGYGFPLPNNIRDLLVGDDGKHL